MSECVHENSCVGMSECVYENSCVGMSECVYENSCVGMSECVYDSMRAGWSGVGSLCFSLTLCNVPEHVCKGIWDDSSHLWHLPLPLHRVRLTSPCLTVGKYGAWGERDGEAM